MKEKSGRTTRETRKKTYKKPVISSEKIFETAALACGKCIAGNPIFKSCTPLRMS